ncbi:hypothetical protein H4R34_000769 [Dimargaris verticillata]|uniref:Uncharacterized protein n=1 Tax=Dimargaris verticillata TaxID=2761393 RepID=A0A9W8BB74_9FUNG|nr:hypothetical protein H4R34_000769 [Dimargaris verticillata]
MGKYRRYFEHRKRSPIEKEKYREERQQQRLQVVPAHESFTHLATPDPVQQDVYANRISKALHNILSGDALPHRTLAAINWTIEKVVLSSDRKHARIWWIPTYHDPNITQERLEGTFEVFGHILERYVNRQLPSKANTKLEFHCAQHLHELMEEVEQQVQTFAQNVRVMSTNDSKPH